MNENKIKKLVAGIFLIMMLGINISPVNAQAVNTVQKEAVEQRTLLTASSESDFIYHIVNDTFSSITDYVGNEDVVVIPSTLGGYTVKRIEYRAFEYGTFTEIDIPDSVNYIAPEAFLNCSKLEKIGYPAGWNQCNYFINDELYDGYAYNKTPFIGCSSLKEITVDEGVTSIPKYAFRGCSSLEKINLPESLERINGYTFDGCTSLKSVILPDNVTEIEHFSFAVCSNLDTVVLSCKLKKIEASTFVGCSSLGEITVPAGVEVINSGVFKNCTSLVKVVLPDTVEVIASYAFENCPFTEIDIPDSVNYIAPEAFLNCSKLEKIGYPAGWSQCFYFINDEFYDGYAYNKTPFIGCSSLKEITVDEGVKSIPKYAFRGCSSLEKVNLPESLERINGYAFNGCSSLTKIVLPCNKLEIIPGSGIIMSDNGFSVADTDNINGKFILKHSYQDGICSCGVYEELVILDVVDNIVKISSPTASDKNNAVTILLASYLDDKLVSVKFIDLPLKSGICDYTVTGFEAGDCDEIRAFVWVDTESLMPLCKCYNREIDINK